MKKLCLMFAVILTVLLTACGEMSQQDVVDKLTSNVEDAKSYYATGVMEVDNNGQVYQYNVEVAYQKDNKYKVTLKNETTNNEQIILKNDEGVFALTPALNKQFKFQSDWPLSSSQVYLYQSLITDILNDAEAVFEATEDAYTFETKANYHGNRDLVSQKIIFDTKELTPTEVYVVDSKGEPRISMKFSSFDFDKKFKDGYFDCQQTMEYSQETMGEGSLAANIDSELYPAYLPEGTTLVNKQAIDIQDGERVIMTFSGDEEFTMIQEPVAYNESTGVEPVSGQPVMINGTIGALSDNSVTWVEGGVECFLVSDTLEMEELVSVAASVSNLAEK